MEPTKNGRYSMIQPLSLDFMPIDKAKGFMAGTDAVSSGTTSVYNTNTVYIANGNRPSKENLPAF